MTERSKTTGVDADNLPPISPDRLAEIDAIPDDQINTTDIPELPASFFATATIIKPIKISEDD